MSAPEMTSLAVVLEAPGRLALTRLDLVPPTEADVVVDVSWSGISTGTERLLYTGRMPTFPGMGYPLVPGYESVGVVREAGPASGRVAGERVFVPGANCYRGARGLFGGAASRVVVPGNRVMPCPATGADDADADQQAVLLALAATAYHVTTPPAGSAPGAARLAHPDLIVGHGVLGRLLARLGTLAGDENPASAAPTVWETDPARRAGANGYKVLDPSEDPRRDYRTICDCSGDPAVLDTLISRLAPDGEIVLAGFYHQPVSFSFPPAFMREARLRIAAEWKPADLAAIVGLVASGRLSLDGLITHRSAATDAPAAYETAFGDAACLKMILDWRRLS